LSSWFWSAAAAAAQQPRPSAMVKVMTILDARRASHDVFARAGGRAGVSPLPTLRRTQALSCTRSRHVWLRAESRGQRSCPPTAPSRLVGVPTRISLARRRSRSRCFETLADLNLVLRACRGALCNSRKKELFLAIFWPYIFIRFVFVVLR
jgi:hypothetical protein